MIIWGFQKLTLIDYPNKLACNIFLSGCNFKCGFCHNPELINNLKENYSEEEILKFLDLRKGKLEGVCISGGEPLLNIDINFLKKIKDKGYSIKIDTNGSFPEKLKEIINEKLVDYVAMDVKTTKEKYKQVINSEVNLDKIEESIKIISNLNNYEFRTTIVRKYHDLNEIKKICEWLKELTGKKLKNYSLQGFKNLGKFVDESFKNELEVNEEFLFPFKKVAENYFENVEIKA